MSRFHFHSLLALLALAVAPAIAVAQRADQDATDTSRGEAARQAAPADTPTARSQASDPAEAGQPARGSRATTQPGQRGSQQGRLGQRQRQGGQQGQQWQLTQMLAGKLMLGNHEEVELGKMAAARATTDSVKQFAQKMIEDHQRLNEQLKQFAPDSPAAARITQGSTQPGQAQPGQLTQTQPGQTQPAPSTDIRTERAYRSEDAQPALGAQRGGQAQSNLQRQLTRVAEQSAENCLRMTKELLEQYEGQDFEMGYLGHQIIAHTQMLAHLQAAKDHGTPEFRQIVQQAEQSTQEHLDQAKQLARQLEDDRSPAARSSDAGSTSGETNELGVPPTTER